jgi:hypothetical protein
MAHAQQAWRGLPVGTVEINNVFGGAEMTTMMVVHWSTELVSRESATTDDRTRETRC